MNNQILNHEGKVIKQKGKLRLTLEWLGKNWKLWVPILLSTLAFVVAIWANLVANVANEIASENYDLTVKPSKLDFRPIMRLDTLFKPIGKIPPHLSITNIGPIEGHQIKIKMFSHRYLPQRNKIFMSASQSMNDIFIEKVTPDETKSFKFNEGWINQNARLHKPPQHNIMEIKITYRRPQDLAEYDESAYYFVNPEGNWVTEYSSDLDNDLYENIKSAIHHYKSRQDPIYMYAEVRGDKLHSNK